MSIRQYLRVSLWIAAVVLGLSTSSIVAHESTQSARRDQPQVTSPESAVFTITDMSIQGNQLILHGLRSKGQASAPLTVNVPNDQSTEDAKAARNRFFNRVFNRDSAS